MDAPAASSLVEVYIYKNNCRTDVSLQAQLLQLGNIAFINSTANPKLTGKLQEETTFVESIKFSITHLTKHNIECYTEYILVPPPLILLSQILVV